MLRTFDKDFFSYELNSTFQSFTHSWQTLSSFLPNNLYSLLKNKMDFVLSQF